MRICGTLFASNCFVGRPNVRFGLLQAAAMSCAWPICLESRVKNAQMSCKRRLAIVVGQRCRHKIIQTRCCHFTENHLSQAAAGFRDYCDQQRCTLVRRQGRTGEVQEFPFAGPVPLLAGILYEIVRNRPNSLGFKEIILETLVFVQVFQLQRLKILVGRRTVMVCRKTLSSQNSNGTLA